MYKFCVSLFGSPIMNTSEMHLMLVWSMELIQKLATYWSWFPHVFLPLQIGTKLNSQVFTSPLHLKIHFSVTVFPFISLYLTLFLSYLIANEATAASPIVVLLTLMLLIPIVAVYILVSLAHFIFSHYPYLSLATPDYQRYYCFW